VRSCPVHRGVNYYPLGWEMQFRILGPLEVWNDTTTISLPGEKRQVVLCMLLLADNRSVSLGRLIDAVWDQNPPVTASKQIRNAVSNLRKRLAAGGVSITLSGDGYRLEPSGVELDAIEFSRAVTHARQARDSGRPEEARGLMRAALALWRDSALVGLDIPSLRAQLDGLNQQRLTVLEECVELELAHGVTTTLIAELFAQVNEHPLQERLVGQLMRALARSGARARALSVYEQTSAVLLDEIGVRPGPELQQLYHKILAGSGVVPALSTAHLERVGMMERRIRQLEQENAQLKRGPNGQPINRLSAGRSKISTRAPRSA
jgi:DNA-binding SARP family transcriptional activator